MRALKTVLFATTTLLSCAAATAAHASPPPPPAAAQQMEDMQGTYALSDGRRARIFIMNDRLYLDLGRHYKALEPAGPDSWVTHDHALSLQFKPGGERNQIVLNYRGDLPDAAPIRLAARDQRGRGGID